MHNTNDAFLWIATALKRKCIARSRKNELAQLWETVLGSKCATNFTLLWWRHTDTDAEYSNLWLLFSLSRQHLKFVIQSFRVNSKIFVDKNRILKFHEGCSLSKLAGFCWINFNLARQKILVAGFAALSREEGGKGWIFFWRMEPNNNGSKKRHF